MENYDFRAVKAIMGYYHFLKHWDQIHHSLLSFKGELFFCREICFFERLQLFIIMHYTSLLIDLFQKHYDIIVYISLVLFKNQLLIAQKTEFFIMDFFSKCDQICSFLWICIYRRNSQWKTSFFVQWLTF